MNIDTVKGGAAEKLRKAIEEGIGEEAARNVRIDSTEKGVSVSYVAGKTGSEAFAIDLEEAEDGSINLDPNQIESLKAKIGKDIGKHFDFKDLGEDTVKGVVQESVADFVGKYGANSFSNTYLCVFAILRILQDSAAKLKKVAIEARSAAMHVEIQAIEAQAAEEKSAAIKGLIAAGVVFAFQATATVIAGKVKAGAESAHDNMVAKDPNVKLAKDISTNTQLLNDPEKANEAMRDAAKDLQNDRSEEIMKELGGYGLKENEKFKDSYEGLPRAKLDTEFQKAPEETEGLKTQKAEYVKTLNEGVEKAEKDYSQAYKDYERERKKEHPDPKKLEQLKNECETKRKEYVFANATRTAAIANGPKGEPLLDKDERESMIIGQEESVDLAETTAGKTPEARKLWRESNRAETFSKTTDSFNTLLGSIPQMVAQSLRGKAILLEKDRKLAEDGYARSQDVVESTKESERKVIQLYGRVAESNFSSLKSII